MLKKKQINKYYFSILKINMRPKHNIFYKKIIRILNSNA